MASEDLERLSRHCLFEGVVLDRLRKATQPNHICIRTEYLWKVCSMLRAKRALEPALALRPDRQD
jgi:hypothetical protein